MRFDVMVTYLFHRQESLSSSLGAATTCVRVINGRADSPIMSADFVGVPAMNYTYDEKLSNSTLSGRASRVIDN